MFDVACISILMLCVHKRFDLKYKFKISRPKYLFLWCLFLTKKWVQNGVYRNEIFFLLWDWLKVRQVAPFCTTYRCLLLRLQSTATQIIISINMFICVKYYIVWNQFFIKIYVKVMTKGFIFKFDLNMKHPS